MDVDFYRFRLSSRLLLIAVQSLDHSGVELGVETVSEALGLRTSSGEDDILRKKN